MGREGNIVRVSGLRFSYGPKEVLRGVSLDVEAGHFYGLVGPNGCGKTTLLDLILGAKRPVSGSVLVRGKEAGGYNRRVLARELALVPQEYHISFTFTVEEIILMGRHPYRGRLSSPSVRDRKIAEEVMERLELTPFRQRYITRLSGGEKQRVIFARALAQDTRILLLDEATSNMDIYYTFLCLRSVAEEVEKNGRTVIATFHDLNLAGGFCDRMVFLKEGCAVAQGQTRDVLNAENVMDTFGVPCTIMTNPIDGTKQVFFKTNGRSETAH
ncbi:MAG: ABC transporter ATP-binding protein [Deltaproteobacteria bacterium]|nr:ABC transporter ATP-binding protein [Deltaproteobacteria bacterium]MBW2137400.1 ABC transporter ATP-binding protein [Deltaproteobacteria bacterium]